MFTMLWLIYVFTERRFEGKIFHSFLVLEISPGLSQILGPPLVLGIGEVLGK
jgi:hypothetical protein